jgi:hypothetical protein
VNLLGKRRLERDVFRLIRDFGGSPTRGWSDSPCWLGGGQQGWRDRIQWICVIV